MCAHQSAILTFTDRQHLSIRYMKLSFLQLRNQPVRIHRHHMQIGNTSFQSDEKLALEGLPGALSVQALLQAAEGFARLAHDHLPLQFGVLAFAATGNSRALDFYFPITQMLTEPEIDNFYQLTDSLAVHPHFDLQLIGEGRANLTSRMPSGIREVVAGQVAEVFYFRREILEQFLATPRHFQLYTSPWAFQQDGGAAGGDYNPQRESIQLVYSRLFEGFFGET